MTQTALPLAMKRIFSTFRNSCTAQANLRTAGMCVRSPEGRTIAVGISVMAAILLLLSGGTMLQGPVEASSKQGRAAGAVIFHEKGCEHCHGVDGIGTDRGPDLSTIGKRWKREHIEHQIREGGGSMPAFGDALQPDEIKSLVEFLGAKRKAPKSARPVIVVPPASDGSGQ